MEFIRENNRIIYVVDGKTLAYVTFPKLNENSYLHLGHVNCTRLSFCISSIASLS